MWPCFLGPQMIGPALAPTQRQPQGPVMGLCPYWSHGGGLGVLVEGQKQEDVQKQQRKAAHRRGDLGSGVPQVPSTAPFLNCEVHCVAASGLPGILQTLLAVNSLQESPHFWT